VRSGAWPRGNQPDDHGDSDEGSFERGLDSQQLAAVAATSRDQPAPAQGADAEGRQRQDRGGNAETGGPANRERQEDDVVLSRLSPHTPYLVIAVRFLLLGAGIAITAAPATGLILTSVPLSKAGVGSAVNDTTRELGGALGIALLGSIVNTAYRSGIDLSGTGLPAGARAAARESIGAADAIAGRIPGGKALAAQAASAFSDAFKVANAISICIALTVAAGILVAWRRRREPVVVEDVEEEPAEVGVELARVPVPVRPCP
jgi:hypothetical protein